MSELPIASNLFDRIVAIRRDLHRHPELSWKEMRTSDKIRAFLDSLGIPHRAEVAGTGVVADFPGRNPDAGCIALRADIDALPVIEETGLPFASENTGVMHACGHDGHTSILLGVASLLAGQTSELPVPVRLLFQPAEETGNGAVRMIEDGALEGVSLIFGGHIDRHFPLGSIVVTDGCVNASADEFLITIGGEGGHAGRPHETIDAVVVGSLLIMAIQTIVSREINPAHPSVVTVGRFEAGSAPNVIASRARLSGTIRAQDADVRAALKESLLRISRSVGQLHGAQVVVEFDAGLPPVFNPAEPTLLCREAARNVVGEENVRSLEIANMGSEDFAAYLEKIPGCYVRFGSVVEGIDSYPAHSSRFDFDERVLAYAIAYYQQLVGVAAAHLLGQSP